MKERERHLTRNTDEGRLRGAGLASSHSRIHSQGKSHRFREPSRIPGGRKVLTARVVRCEACGVFGRQLKKEIEEGRRKDMSVEPVKRKFVEGGGTPALQRELASPKTELIKSSFSSQCSTWRISESRLTRTIRLSRETTPRDFDHKSQDCKHSEHLTTLHYWGSRLGERLRSPKKKRSTKTLRTVSRSLKQDLSNKIQKLKKFRRTTLS